MLFYTVGQAQVFLALAVSGLLLGAIYDACALLRRLLEAGPTLSLLTDMIFGVAAFLVLAAALLASNYGEVRLYALMGAAAGCALYRVTLGAMARAALRVCARAARRAKAFAARSKILAKIFR